MRLLANFVPLNLRGMLRSLSWLGAVSLVAKPMWFIFITVVCVRALGAARYGEMITALSLAALSFSFTGFGIGDYTVREVSRQRDEASLFLSNFLVVRVVSVGLAWLVAILVGSMLSYTGPLWSALLFASAYTMFEGVTLYVRHFFRIFEQLRYEAFSIALEKTLVIGFGISLLYLTRTSYGTLAGMALGMAVTSIVTLRWTTRFAAIRWNLVSWPFAKNALRLMVPFGLAAIFQLFYFRTDQVMIEAFMGTEPAGHYGLAYRSVEALNMVPLLLAQAAVFPRVTRLFEQNQRDRFAQIIRGSLIGLAALGLAVAATLTIAAPGLVQFITGDAAYEQAGHALQLLTWTFPLASLRLVLYVALVAMGQERFVANAIGATMIFNIIANVLLIPFAGIIGACITTVASEALLVMVYASRYRRML